MHADTTRGEGSQESFGNHDEKVKLGWNPPPSPRTTLGGGWLAVCGGGGGGGGGWRLASAAHTIPGRFDPYSCSQSNVRVWRGVKSTACDISFHMSCICL